MFPSRSSRGGLELNTFAVTDWLPLATDDAGGPLISDRVDMKVILDGHEEIREAQKKMAEGFAGAGGGLGAAFQQAFASDPRMKDAFEENMEEMKDLDGMAVKTIASFVTVPYGKELDKDAVLAATDQPLGEGAGAVAAEGARQAAREAMRIISALLGPKQKQEEEAEEEAGPMAQVITMRTVTTIHDARSGASSLSISQPTEGYEEWVPEWMRRGPGI